MMRWFNNCNRWTYFGSNKEHFSPNVSAVPLHWAIQKLKRCVDGLW